MSGTREQAGETRGQVSGTGGHKWASARAGRVGKRAVGTDERAGGMGKRASGTGEQMRVRVDGRAGGQSSDVAS